MAPVHPLTGTIVLTVPRRTAHRRWTVPLGVVLLAASLRLLPSPELQALDRMAIPAASAGDAEETPSRNPLDTRGDTFPGSAYFFAQDAFAAITPASGNPHILQIEAGPAALSMPLRAATGMDQARAVQCLTSAIYYEAGNEPDEGQRAVAQVILNRVASGAWPNSICGVIYQGGERSDRGCQFTFSCDGSMARVPTAAGWARARRGAMRALSGDVFAPAGLATFYHTLAVHPSWADRMRPVAVIGAHIFYRQPGVAGLPAAFTVRYAGREYAQPGPYAFTKPPRPLSPAGPMPDWTSSAMPAPPAPDTAAAPVPSSPEPARPPVHSRSVREAGLPESTIRPEYRNTGRPLY